jgi:uncharacterized protein YigE (DUF2233 family)
MKAFNLLILALFLLAVASGCSRGTNGTAPPTSAQKASAEGLHFTTIRVDVRTEHLELFFQDDAGRPFNRFDRLKSWLEGQKKQLRFAMNAGMYQPDFLPGWLVGTKGSADLTSQHL